MKVSEKGINLIKQFEGLYLKAYLCPAGVPTIGIGTIRYPDGRKVSLSDPPITEEQAIGFLKYELENIELKVDAFTTDKVNQNQFDSLVSFAYNLGCYVLKGSTLLKKVNVNPFDATIRKEFIL